MTSNTTYSNQNYQLLLLCDNWSCSKETLFIWKNQ